MPYKLISIIYNKLRARNGPVCFTRLGNRHTLQFHSLRLELLKKLLEDFDRATRVYISVLHASRKIRAKLILNKQQQSTQGNYKVVIFLIVAFLVAALAWYVNAHFSLEQLAEQDNRLRTYISLNRERAFVLGFCIYVVLALVPGTGGKSIACGWLFGFWPAMVIATLGLTLAAMVIFSLSRYLVRESIERRYTRFLLLMNKHLEKEGAFYLLTLRMAHAPVSIVNPVSGASRVRSWTFFWTTLLGLIPANAIWCYVGVRLPSLHELLHNGPASFIDLPLIAALVTCAALPLLIRWLISRFGMPVTDTKSHDATMHDS